MTHPPDRIGVAAQPHRILQDLSAMERWVEGDREGRPEPYTDKESWEGPEFRVETVSDNSMHTVLGISVRREPGQGPPGPPGPGALPDGPDEEERAVLRSTVRAVLDLADIRSGPARTTVVLTERGPRVVSCRLGDGEVVFARERRPGPR